MESLQNARLPVSTEQMVEMTQTEEGQNLILITALRVILQKNLYQSAEAIARQRAEGQEEPFFSWNRRECTDFNLGKVAQYQSIWNTINENKILNRRYLSENFPTNLALPELTKEEEEFFWEDRLSNLMSEKEKLLESLKDATGTEPMLLSFQLKKCLQEMDEADEKLAICRT
jgi:hypothetical protein